MSAPHTLAHYDALFLRTLDRGPEMFGRADLTIDEIAFIAHASPADIAEGLDLDERRARLAAARLEAAGRICFNARGHVERVSPSG